MLHNRGGERARARQLGRGRPGSSRGCVVRGRGREREEGEGAGGAHLLVRGGEGVLGAATVLAS
jgi:hypothetical protein